MSLADKLSELEALFKGETVPWVDGNDPYDDDTELHTVGNQDFIARCNIVREVLRDLYEQKDIPSTESMGNLMYEVGAMPLLSTTGCLI